MLLKYFYLDVFSSFQILQKYVNEQSNWTLCTTMNPNTSSQFISSLAKYLQNLCNGYVDYNKLVIVKGHLYVTVDTDKSIGFVVNEQLCKNDGNPPRVLSNSFQSPGEYHNHGRDYFFQNPHINTEEPLSATVTAEQIKTIDGENLSEENLPDQSTTELSNRKDHIHHFENPPEAKYTIRETNSMDGHLPKEIDISSRVCHDGISTTVIDPITIKEELVFSDTEGMYFPGE